MRYYPYHYQSEATDFIINHNYCAIMLDIGRGKKVITLSALQKLKYDYFESSKVLIVTSKNAAKNRWLIEMQKWDHLKDLRWSLIVGNEKEKMRAIQKQADIYITNHESLSWIISNQLWSFDTVVLDSLSDYKNERTKRFKLLCAVHHRIKRIIGLTAMLSANGLEDLWAEMFLLDCGQRLGRNKGGFYERFFFTSRKWFGGNIKYVREPKNGAKEAIEQAISDICWSTTERNFADVPICVYRDIYVKMSPVEYSKYQWMKKEMSMQIADVTKISASKSIAQVSKLAQIANGTVYDDAKQIHKVHEKKLEALEELIKESSGKNILIAYWFQHDKISIMERFPNAKVIETEKDVQDWNDNKITIGLMNPATGGKNVNMYLGGNTLIWYSLTWSLELYDRMNRRLYGGRNTNKVVIIHILTRNTIDEKIIEALKKKKNGQDELFKEIHISKEELYDNSAK